MKNKTQAAAVTNESPMKLVQLNARVPAAIKDAVVDLAARTKITHETIVADALALFYGAETPGASLRKHTYSEAIKQLEAEGRLILFSPTTSRRPAHGPCSDTAGHFTLKAPSENPLRNAIYGIIDVLGLSGVPQEMLHPLAV